MIMRRAHLKVLICSIAAGCGGGNAAPTPPVSTAPSAPTITATTVPELGNRNSVTFTVTSGSTGVTNWVVEIGRQSGLSDVSTITTSNAEATFVIRPLPIGVLYARVYAQGAGGKSAASAEALLGSYDPREIIDAMLMGAGPLAVSGNSGCRGGIMEGWAWGTTVKVQTAAGLSASHQTAAGDTAAQVASMTAGQVNAVVQSVGDPGGTAFNPGADTILIRQGSAQEVRDQCRCTSCVGCATSFYRGNFKAGVYVQVGPTTTGPTTAHEIGHGIGLCHIISAAGFTPPLTMGVTTDGEFSPTGRSSRQDAVAMKAMETVYAAGMQAGETRSRFAALGLVPPSGGLGENGDGQTIGNSGTLSWSTLRETPASELRRFAEDRFGKGARVEFDASGEARVTKPFCSGPIADK
jgi:hypothetical protein